MTMFTQLKKVRDTLAAVPAFALDAETRKELVAAIDELDDAMVADKRAEQFISTLPPISNHSAASLFGGETLNGKLIA